MTLIEELNRRFLLQEEYLGTNKPVNAVKPLVSVRIATYQHAPYIKRCIESILMQETNFPFEIIIGEDESTDGTREICKKFAEEHPDKIRLFLRDRNLSQYYENGKIVSRFNSRWNSMSCRGDLVAICEGDDYWTDKHKLQKQADFLLKNKDYSFCCSGYIHRNAVTGEERTVVHSKPGFEDGAGFTFGLEDMCKRWLTKTLTSMYRVNVFNFDILYQYKHGRDIHFFYHLITAGKGYYFKEVFGVYNVHPGGINSMQQGKVNTNAAYNSYKELFEFNKNEFTRERAFKATVSLLNYDLFNKYPGNTFKRKSNLLKEAVSLIKKPAELKMLLGVFVPRSVKSRLSTE